MVHSLPILSRNRKALSVTTNAGVAITTKFPECRAAAVDLVSCCFVEFPISPTAYIISVIDYLMGDNDVTSH